MSEKNREKSRKRSKNYTLQDKQLLIDCVLPYKKVLECNVTNKKSASAKREAWNKICNAFNSMTDVQRDVKSLYQFYLSFKMKVKKENAVFKMQRSCTGGGPPPEDLDPVSVKFLSVFGKSVYPGVCEFDNGGEYHEDNNKQESSSDEQVENAEVEHVIETLNPDDIIAIVDNGVNIDTVENGANIETVEITEVELDNNNKEFSKFPSSKKRKRDANDDKENAELELKRRREEREKMEDELVAIKRDNFLKQSKLLNLQIETAELNKKSAEIELQLKERKLSENLI